MKTTEQRDPKAEAQRAYERNLAELIEVLARKAEIEVKAKNMNDEIGRLVYCLARDRAIFQAGGGQ